MNMDDDKFNTEIKRAWLDNDEGRAPTFAATWLAAEDRYVRSQRRYRMYAGTAAVVAIGIVGLYLQSPPSDSDTYVEVAELLESTSWSAPSDVLLPEKEFDIYQDIPVLTESTY